MDTTTMWSVFTISEPSCWSPLPLMSPPPWIMTRTGSRPASRPPPLAAGAPGGVNTFRYRQSSVSDRGPFPLASCGQRFP